MHIWEETVNTVNKNGFFGGICLSFGREGLQQIYIESDASGYPLEYSLRSGFPHAEWIGSERFVCREPYDNLSSFFQADEKTVHLAVRGREPFLQKDRVADTVVPFTSVLGYNPRCKGKGFYLYVNREEMMIRLIGEALKDKYRWFEIGKNTDLVAENRITGNLKWITEEFARCEKGFLTFTTSFVPSAEIYKAEHRCRTVLRMKMSPTEIINSREPLTDPLHARIHGVNRLSYAGYPVGIAIAPVVLVEGWRELYSELFDILEATLCDEVKRGGTVEIVFFDSPSVTESEKLEAAEFLIRTSLKKLPLMSVTDVH